MSAERGDFDAHVRIKRERLQDGMQLIVCIHLENTNIRKAPYNPPQVLPLARLLKVGRPLMLELSESLDRFAVDVGRNSDLDSHVKKHELSLLDLALALCNTGVKTAMTDAWGTVISLQRPDCDQ
jgi:hypothetical protein